MAYYAAVMGGGHSSDGKVQHYQARKLKVKASPKQEVMADGVALGKGAVTIKVRRGALRIITAAEELQKDPSATLPQPVTGTIEENHREARVISLR
jgi:diacylglycerol kinase family enzyme